ncbi:MAG: PQQ-binding-like beta-propeller repeat protein [Melioribacteraceae bacterium]|nr:PQQ-binding-like beta-propeller repeat protein [Melioribacteraceae bacterium]
MKKLILIISSLALFYSCTNPLILKNSHIDDSGILTFGRTGERNFYYDKSITEFLQLKWTAETNGSQPNSSVLVSGDFVIVSDLSGRVYAFDRTSGKMIGYEKNDGSISTAPVLKYFRLYYAVNEKNHFYSTFKMFDFVNNKVLVEDRISGSVTNEMIRMEDGIAVLTNRGELIKYNYTASRVWSTNLKSSIKSNPATNDHLIALGTMSGELILINKVDGSIVYREKISTSIEGGFTFENDWLYFGDNDGIIYSFDTKSNKIVWRFNTGSKILATPVFDSEKLIVGNLSGRIFAVNKNSGEKIWMVDTKGLINTTPMLTKTFLVQPDNNKKVYMINASLGIIVKTYEFDRRVKLTPVLYDGMIFLGSDRGQIHAYQTFDMN